MQYWIIRAGQGGKYIDDFLKYNTVAIGWDEVKDLQGKKSRSEIEKILRKCYPQDSKASVSINTSQLWKFCEYMKKGDIVLTPNPLTRTIHIGIIKGDYRHIKQKFGDMHYKHRRKVSWEKEVSRDLFTQDMKNSIGSTLTIFNVSKYAKEIDGVLFSSVSGFPSKGKIKFPLNLP